MLSNTLPVHVPEVADNPRVSLFEQLVLSIGKANTMKKQLNAYHQCCRIDLDDIEVVSDDEAEDPIMDNMDFLGLPCPSTAALGPGPPPSMALPIQPTAGIPPCHNPSPTTSPLPPILL